MSEIDSAIAPSDLTGLAALASTAPAGCFVEVGVWRGGSAKVLEQIAQERDVEFFAYDTFTGIPFKDKMDFHDVGDFGDTSFEAVRDALPHTTVVKGLFPDSAVPMPPIAFAHIDVDQYRSIKESVLYLRDKMSPGGIMLFDDAGVEFLPGATRAVEELFGNKIEHAHSNKFFVRF